MKRYAITLLAGSMFLVAGFQNLGSLNSQQKEQMIKKMMDANTAYMNQEHIQKQLKAQKKIIIDREKKGKAEVEYRTKRDYLIRKAISLQEKMIEKGEKRKSVALNHLIRCVYEADSLWLIDSCKDRYKKEAGTGR